ncbi:hypothetical protein BGW38_002760 [Lunasporangiospora selenospora]|uniref:Uncharacterized protein n=1 Tax=Lunasporangiospora selenospora TaxID=979761 RepID=A0A9P6G3U9_9FUNG|nr:hypothetical protein BGW38_002760 [Lunasporangiospora selenospora]
MSIGRHVLAAFTAFETILILLEMVVSHKVGKAQRRILKEELRRQKGEEEVVAAAAFPSQGRARSETGQDDLSVEPTTLESTSSSRPEQTTQNWDPLVDSERANNHASESNGQQGPRREGTDSAVEIVRPAEVDPSAILLSQQLMYEAFQRQQKQQFQLFFMAQQQLQTQSPSANALMELKGDDDDDIPVLLSQKIEIPSDHAKDATSLVSVTVFPPFSNSAGTQYLHVPSAPPKSAFSQDTPKSIQYQTQQYGIEKTPFPLTGEDDKKQVVVEPCIPVMVSMDIVQSKASAPPLEPQS